MAATAALEDESLVIGEAVALEVAPASVLLRAAGALIDALVYVGTFILLALALGAFAGDRIDDALGQATIVVVLVLALVIAPFLVEVASHGRSVGRLVIGARVVRLDGGAVQPRHAFVRALIGVVELYMTVGGIAVVAGLVTRRSQRLGDVLAGTYARMERLPRPVPLALAMPASLTNWAGSADVARLPDALGRRIAHFLGQAPQMSPASRARLAHELVSELTSYLSPVPSADDAELLVAVAVIRRDREYRALTAQAERTDRLAPTLTAMPHGFPRR